MKTLYILSDQTTTMRTNYPVGLTGRSWINREVQLAIGNINIAISYGLRFTPTNLSSYTNESIATVEALISEAV